MAQVTIAQLQDALNEVKEIATQKRLNSIDLNTDTPRFHEVLGLIIVDGLEGTHSMDEQLAIISNMLKAALLSVPSVVQDIHNDLMMVASQDNNIESYANLSAMSPEEVQKSSEAALNDSLNIAVNTFKTICIEATQLAAAQMQPTPAPKP